MNKINKNKKRKLYRRGGRITYYANGGMYGRNVIPGTLLPNTNIASYEQVNQAQIDQANRQLTEIDKNNWQQEYQNRQAQQRQLNQSLNTAATEGIGMFTDRLASGKGIFGMDAQQLAQRSGFEDVVDEVSGEVISTAAEQAADYSQKAGSTAGYVGLGADLIGGLVDDDDPTKWSAGEVITDVGGSAAKGAQMGSALGPIGTAAGAVIGAGVGAYKGITGRDEAREMEKQEEAKRKGAQQSKFAGVLGGKEYSGSNLGQLRLGGRKYQGGGYKDYTVDQLKKMRLAHLGIQRAKTLKWSDDEVDKFIKSYKDKETEEYARNYVNNPVKSNEVNKISSAIMDKQGKWGLDPLAQAGQQLKASGLTILDGILGTKYQDGGTDKWKKYRDHFLTVGGDSIKPRRPGYFEEIGGPIHDPMPNHLLPPIGDPIHDPMPQHFGPHPTPTIPELTPQNHPSAPQWPWDIQEKNISDIERGREMPDMWKGIEGQKLEGREMPTMDMRSRRKGGYRNFYMGGGPLKYANGGVGTNPYADHNIDPTTQEGLKNYRKHYAEGTLTREYTDPITGEPIHKYSWGDLPEITLTDQHVSEANRRDAKIKQMHEKNPVIAGVHDAQSKAANTIFDVATGAVTLHPAIGTAVAGFAKGTPYLYKGIKAADKMKKLHYIDKKTKGHPIRDINPPSMHTLAHTIPVMSGIMRRGGVYGRDTDAAAEANPYVQYSQMHPAVGGNYLRQDFGSIPATTNEWGEQINPSGEYVFNVPLPHEKMHKRTQTGRSSTPVMTNWNDPNPVVRGSDGVSYETRDYSGGIWDEGVAESGNLGTLPSHGGAFEESQIGRIGARRGSRSGRMYSGSDRGFMGIGKLHNYRTTGLLGDKRRNTVKGLVDQFVESPDAEGRRFIEGYTEGQNLAKTTRRKEGSLNIQRDKTKQRGAGFLGKLGIGFGRGHYVRKTGEGFLGLQNRRKFIDGKEVESQGFLGLGKPKFKDSDVSYLDENLAYDKDHEFWQDETQNRKGGYRQLPGGIAKPIPGSDAIEFIGKKHEQGGIKLDPYTEVEDKETMDKVKGNDYFFSSHLRLGGKSFAARHKQILAAGGKQKDIDELASIQEKMAGRDKYDLGGERRMYETGGEYVRRVKTHDNQDDLTIYYDDGKGNIIAFNNEFAYMEHRKANNLPQDYSGVISKAMPDGDENDAFVAAKTKTLEYKEEGLDYKGEIQNVNPTDFQTTEIEGRPFQEYADEMNLYGVDDVFSDRITGLSTSTLPGPDGEIGTDDDITNVDYNQGMAEWGENWLLGIDPAILEAAEITDISQLLGPDNKENVKRLQQAYNDAQTDADLKIKVDGYFGEQTRSIYQIPDISIEETKPELLDTEEGEIPESEILPTDDPIPSNVKESKNKLRKTKGKGVNWLDTATVLGGLAQLAPAYMSYKQEPDYMSSPGRIPTTHLDRVRYNAEREQNEGDYRGMGRFIETSGAGPGGIAAKMAAWGKKQSQDVKIGSAEAQQNAAIQAQEAQLNSQNAATNIKNSMYVDEYNRMQDSDSKQRKVMALQNATQSIAGMIGDIRQYQATDKLATATEGVTGVGDRFDKEYQYKKKTNVSPYNIDGTYTDAYLAWETKNYGSTPSPTQSESSPSVSEVEEEETPNLERFGGQRKKSYFRNGGSLKELRKERRSERKKRKQLRSNKAFYSKYDAQYDNYMENISKSNKRTEEINEQIANIKKKKRLKRKAGSEKIKQEVYSPGRKFRKGGKLKKMC